MAVKTVIVSDLTGEEVPDDEHARIVINDHPLLPGGPVELDVSIDEAEKLQTSRIDLVNLMVFAPNRAPRRVVLDAAAFAKAFDGVDVDEVITNARRVEGQGEGSTRRRPGGRSAPTPKADRVDYSSLEHAGRPHRGRITDAEKETVRDNLEAVNRRLADEGRPTIDPGDPATKRKWGF